MILFYVQKLFKNVKEDKDDSESEEEDEEEEDGDSGEDSDSSSSSKMDDSMEDETVDIWVSLITYKKLKMHILRILICDIFFLNFS